MATGYFPGHMAKTLREIRSFLPLIDVGLVLIDARIPRASLGRDWKELLRGRQVIYALNKADLADPDANGRWLARLGTAFLINARNGRGVEDMLTAALEAGRARSRRRGRPVRAVILGIPNVGKSSLLNRAAGRRAAAVGDKPGVTRGRQWVKAGPELEILDTPGLLEPRMEDRHTALLLTLMAAVKGEIFGREELACEAMSLIEKRYPGRLTRRYGFEPCGECVSDLESIGRARGHLSAGGKVDTGRSANALLSDLRAGRLGRMTFEDP